MSANRRVTRTACKLKYGIDPFIFLTNGDEIWFWHRSLYPPRLVSGFFTQDDLERLAFIDRFHEPPSLAEVNPRIVDRAYQIEAVKTVAERIELGYRRFLLVMATGTGKTRVAIALVDLLRRQKWIQRVLFLADRRELVKQAIGAFKEHLPDAPRCWIEGGDIDQAATIHAATYPGMMGLYPPTVPRLLRPDHLRRESPLHLPPLQGHPRPLRRHSPGPDRDPDRLHRPQHLRTLRLRERPSHPELQL